MSTEVQNNIGMDPESAKSLVNTYTMSEDDAKNLVNQYNTEEPTGLDYAADISKGVVKGPLNAIKEAAKTLADWNGSEAKTPWMDYLLDATGELETAPGKITEGFSRFISSYALLRGYGKATTFKGKLLESTVKGSVVDFTIWNKDDGRLSNILADNGIENVVVDYLKSDPSDSIKEDKFKHTIEGMLTGIVSETVIAGIVKGYSGAKAKAWSKGKLPQEVAIDVDNLVDADKIIPDAPKTTHTTDEVAQEAIVTKIDKEVKVAQSKIKVEAQDTESISTPVLATATAFPKTLGSPKPRYRNQNIEFESDLDKAIYILGSKRKSARYNDFLQWAVETSGKTQEELMVLSKDMRATLKKNADEGSPLTVKAPIEVGRVSDASNLPNIKYEEGFPTTKKVYTDKPPYTAFNYEKILAGIDEANHKQATEILENITKSEDFIRFAKTGTKPLDITVKQAELMSKKLGFQGIVELAAKTTKTASKLDAQLIMMKVATATELEKVLKAIKIAEPTDRVALINNLRELQALSILTAGTKSLQMGGARVTTAGRVEIIPKEVLDTLEELQEVAPLVFKEEADKLIDDAAAVRIHKQLKKLVDIESDVTLHRVMKGIADGDGRGMKTVNVLTEMRLTGLLSSPVTLMKNVGGNYFVRKASNVEYRLAGTLGKWRGDKDRFLDDEVEALTNGSAHQANETIHNFVKAIKQIPKGSPIEYTKAMDKARAINAQIADTTDKALIKQLKIQEVEAIKNAQQFKPYEDTLEESYLDFYQKYDTGSYRAISSNYLMDNVDTPLRQNIGKTIDGIGALIRVPYQALGVTDDMFKRVIYGSEMKYIATREANILELKNTEKQEFIKGFFKAHEDLFLKKSKEGMSDEQRALVEKFIAPNKGKFHLEAIERAREGTFQEELRNNGNINTALKNLDLILKGVPGGQWVVPFYRTPVNITKWVGRRTPLIHKLSTRMNEDISAGGRRKAHAEARLVMGTSLYAVSGLLAYNGLITGTAPPGEREAWKLAGIGENSIKNPFTGEYVSFSGLDPLGMFMGLTAEVNMFTTDLNRRGKFLLDTKDIDEDLAELSGAMILAFGNQIKNKTWMQSFDELVAWTKGENPNYATRMAATMLPYSSLANFIQNGEGEELKEAIGLFESIKKKYAPDTLRTGLDALGKPQELTSFLGIRTRIQNDSPIRQEIFELRVPVTKMSNKITFKSTTIELEPEDHHKLQLLVENKYHLEERLNNLIASPAYKNAEEGIDFTVNGTKRYKLQSMFSETRARARKYFIATNPKRLTELKEELEKNKATLLNKERGIRKTWIDK